MCLTLTGQIRTQQVKDGEKGKFQVLQVLAKIGRSERLLDIMNFGRRLMPGDKPVSMVVVPCMKKNERSGRQYIGWYIPDDQTQDVEA